jgi:cytoskeletal protein CcmA (bactofilin family)
VAKNIAKITVRCPHCSAEQQEPELVKSTFCRSCSEYFAISALTLAGAPPVPAPIPIKTKRRRAGDGYEQDSSPPPAAAVPEPHASTGLLHKIDEIFTHRPKHRVVQCFECNSAHEVSGTAHSSTCKACGAYIDLEDHKIAGSFSRNIKTRGDVYLGAKGDLSSSKIICRDAIVQGKMRGNMQCTGRLTVKTQGRLTGSVEALELVIERGAEVDFSRPVKVSLLEIHGRVSGQFQADHVAIYKHGSLDGPVIASGFTVEKGGAFEGELTISPRKPAAAAVTTEGEERPSEKPAVEMSPIVSGATVPAVS